MNGNVRDYAKVGIAHFMFWPNCLSQTSVMRESLPQVLVRNDIEAVDCCLPYDRPSRDHLAQLAQNANKHIGYAIHPFPLDKISLGATEDHYQDLIRMVMRDQIEAAAAIGARTFTFATGLDPGNAHRPAALRRFADLCCWLSRELASHGMTGLLEPFDRGPYRGFLLGPTQECVDLLRALPAASNLRIQLDIAHIKLQGETPAEAIAVCGDLLGHVHLGNCVIRDKSDRFYGDKHPPIGYPSGEIGTEELTGVLRQLLEAGYLNPRHRPTLVIEAQPFPGWSAEQTIEDQFRRLDQAWASL